MAIKKRLLLFLSVFLMLLSFEVVAKEIAADKISIYSSASQLDPCNQSNMTFNFNTDFGGYSSDGLTYFDTTDSSCVMDASSSQETTNMIGSGKTCALLVGYRKGKKVLEIITHLDWNSAKQAYTGCHTEYSIPS